LVSPWWPGRCLCWPTASTFLEDTSINLLIFVALGWPLARRALVGKGMTVVICGPAAVAGWQAIQRFWVPVVPDVRLVVLASLGAIAVNATSAWLLARVRHHGGSHRLTTHDPSPTGGLRPERSSSARVLDFGERGVARPPPIAGGSC
jgi:Co/Zn/Cd efflux system component